jgi:hypothetical protein
LENIYARKSNREREFLLKFDEIQKKDQVINNKLEALSSRLKIKEK